MKRAIVLSIVAMAMWSVQSLGAASEEVSIELHSMDQEPLNDNPIALTEWLP